MNSTVKYGLLISLGICLWAMGEYVLGFHSTYMEVGKYSGYFSGIIPGIGFYFALKERRDKELDGRLTFWETLKTGSKMSVIIGAALALFFYFYFKYINPDWMTLVLAFEKNNFLKAGLTEAEMTAKLENLKEAYSLKMQMMEAFFGSLIQGIILSLIMFAFLRKRPAIAQP